MLADNISVAAVPEPSTWAMLLLGFAGFGSFPAAGPGRTLPRSRSPEQQ
jgi:hypothetical protein